MDKSKKERVLHLTKKNFVVQTFRSGGKGGMNQNKRNTGCRIIHPPSGARGESREHRTFLENRKAAFRRLTDSKKFRTWLYIEHCRAVGKIEQWIEDQLRPENLVIEFYEP